MGSETVDPMIGRYPPPFRGLYLLRDACTVQMRTINMCETRRESNPVPLEATGIAYSAIEIITANAEYIKKNCYEIMNGFK